MIYFEKDNKTYGIKIEREGTTTLAHLVEVDDERGITYTGIVGISFLHPNDQMVKKIGRKLAIARLVQLISDSKEGNWKREELDINWAPVLTLEERVKL